MIPIQAMQHRIHPAQGFRPQEDTLAALRRGLNSYPEILALSCKWMSHESPEHGWFAENGTRRYGPHNENNRQAQEMAPLADLSNWPSPGESIEKRYRWDYEYLREEMGRPIALILYARVYLPASRLRHLYLYMKRLFPSFQSSPVWPTISACSESTLLARIYGFEPAGGEDPARAVATLQYPGEESRLDRLAG
ncbi:MAG: hypothetical protein CMF59_06955 [Leptospiraceae bacterium]|nr:hypothetical protein [Leptospiraceae bacterium]